jgi:hypothetical protein
MKLKVTGLKTLLQVTAVVSIVGVCSTAQAQATVVNLQVNASQTKLEITTRGNCSSNNTNGCLQATGNALFNFVLTGNKACSAGGNWKLDNVTLGMSEGSKGNITAKAAADFYANQSTGVVTPDSSNDNHIQIKDDNTAVYEVFYTVTATCDGMPSIDSDPRIFNDGTGTPP